ncbi:hypothetical protein [Methylobacterium sp. Leaf118]|uniref:hypothetical protein n=1 Tax=Methylobacterium sp. Leaf118 TaxID=2876562 RepID=UPI001E5DF0D4|nr:hypothetical protein [Methylobacterium sp. Leaf118]
MLTVITAQTVQPEVEAIDRDPGIITLVSSLVRAVRGTGRPATDESGHRKGPYASPFSASGVLPYRYR